MLELTDKDLGDLDIARIFNRDIERYVEELLAHRWTDIWDNPAGDGSEDDEENSVFTSVKPASHDQALLFLSVDQRKSDLKWRAALTIGDDVAEVSGEWVDTRREAEAWFTRERLIRATVYGLLGVMELKPARRTPTEETYLHQLRLHVPGVGWRKDTETGFIGRLPTTEDPDGSLEVVFHSLTDVHVIHRRKNGELLSQARGASLASAAGKVLEHVKRTGLAMFNLRSVMELDLYKKPEPAPPPASEQVVEALQDQVSRHYRWAYALLVELAKVELDIANSEAQPGEWPAGQDWAGLGGTSKSAFLQRARDRAGIDHDEFLAPVRHGLVDIEDLFEGSKLPPAQVLLERTDEGMRIIGNPIETGPWGEDRAMCRLHAVTNGWAVGFRFDLRGETGFVYLNPSSGSSDPESEPDVFLYYGPAGDPGEDSAPSHTNLGKRG